MYRTPVVQVFGPEYIGLDEFWAKSAQAGDRRPAQAPSQDNNVDLCSGWGEGEAE